MSDYKNLEIFTVDNHGCPVRFYVAGNISKISKDFYVVDVPEDIKRAVYLGGKLTKGKIIPLGKHTVLPSYRVRELTPAEIIAFSSEPSQIYYIDRK